MLRKTLITHVFIFRMHAEWVITRRCAKCNYLLLGATSWGALWKLKMHVGELWVIKMVQSSYAIWCYFQRRFHNFLGACRSDNFNLIKRNESTPGQSLIDVTFFTARLLLLSFFSPFISLSYFAAARKFRTYSDNGSAIHNKRYYTLWRCENVAADCETSQKKTHTQRLERKGRPNDPVLKQ